MEGSNFFKFNLSHKVVKDFNEDHRKSQLIYKDSYAFLQQLGVFKPEEQTAYQRGTEVFRKFNEIHAEMREIFTNLFISYHAFRQAATENAEIMQEFKKIPTDFSIVEKKFTEIMNAYKMATDGFKPLL